MTTTSVRPVSDRPAPEVLPPHPDSDLLHPGAPRQRSAPEELPTRQREPALPPADSLVPGSAGTGVAVLRVGSVVDLRLSGEVDRPAARALAQVLDRLPDRTRHVVVDMTGVTALDTTVPRALVRAHRRLEGAGGGVVVARPPRPVHRLLRWYGAEELLR